MNRVGRRPFGKRMACLVGCSAVLAAALLAAVAGAAGGAEEPPRPTSYEAVASAEGVRFSFGAPGFAVVDTFVDGGGPVSQAVIDGLGNSRAFASLPYPGDLAITGPGLVAGLTGLPAPPPYPFYVSSSHPAVPEEKVAQPGYELAAASSESSSQGSTMTGGQAGSEPSAPAIGSTVTRALTTLDADSGAVTAEATGTADVINIGSVLRIGQVEARAKVTRAPGSEPAREATFVINGMTITGQTVGFSEAGFTFGGTDVPIPAGNPLLEALEQAKISVRYLSRVDNPDGVVSPGLVIRQEQATPGGPTMVIHYVFGQMSASATLSGSASAIGDSLPVVDTGPSDTQVISPPAKPPAPATTTTTGPAAPPSEIGAIGWGGSGGAGGPDYGVVPAAETIPEVAAPVAQSPPSVVQEAAPISGTPMTVVDTASVYLILVAAAAVALAGGTGLRLVGVKLKWTS